ncbi:MAG: HTH-type transcriptional regulator BetI [Anaerolineae bacterium]|nr:HTH-type transcriptional regulator BetI [Anaerolineae bacterium]
MLDNSLDFKEQMAEARRTQILMGAAQVFSEKGFHKATTKEVAKAAGVSEGTIYNYFSTKRDLLVAMVDQLGMNSLKNIFEDSPPQDPRQLLKAIIIDRMHLAAERGPMMAPLLAEIFNDVELRELLYDQVVIPASRHVEQYVRQQIDSGRFRQIDPVIVTRALMGTLVFNVGLKLSGVDDRYNDISFDSLAEQVVTLFLDGLLVDQS